MNYWDRWIGDWKRKTAHLSAEAKGVYGELLDHQYATQKPLPEDNDACCRIAGARSASECKAVAQVLGEFFTLTPQGYMNPRAAEEIARREAYVDAQSKRANMRWHKPVQETAQKAPKVNGASIELPAWLNADTWAAWIKIRPAKARTQEAQAAAIAKLEKFRAEGVDANACVQDSLANGWQGLFRPDKGRTTAPTLAERNAAAIEEAKRIHRESQG